MNGYDLETRSCIAHRPDYLHASQRLSHDPCRGLVQWLRHAHIGAMCGRSMSLTGFGVAKLRAAVRAMPKQYDGAGIQVATRCRITSLARRCQKTNCNSPRYSAHQSLYGQDVIARPGLLSVTESICAPASTKGRLLTCQNSPHSILREWLVPPVLMPIFLVLLARRCDGYSMVTATSAPLHRQDRPSPIRQSQSSLTHDLDARRGRPRMDQARDMPPGDERTRGGAQGNGPYEMLRSCSNFSAASAADRICDEGAGMRPAKRATRSSRQSTACTRRMDSAGCELRPLAATLSRSLSGRRDHLDGEMLVPDDHLSQADRRPPASHPYGGTRSSRHSRRRSHCRGRDDAAHARGRHGGRRRIHAVSEAPDAAEAVAILEIPIRRRADLHRYPDAGPNGRPRDLRTPCMRAGRRSGSSWYRGNWTSRTSIFPPAAGFSASRSMPGKR